LGGRWTTRSPFFKPETTSQFRPSDRPVAISTFFGGDFGPAPGISTKAFLPPSSKTITRSGTRRMSFFSLMTRSALAE
jgi:hypothetical protein